MTTTLMMPSEYGVDMFLGSSPVLTSGYLATQPFMHHDYSRLQPTPLQTTPLQQTPLQTTPLHSIWGHHTTTTNPGSSCGAAVVNSSSFRNPLDSQSSLTCSSAYTSGLATRSSLRRSGSGRAHKKKIETPPLLLPIKSCLVARQEEDPEEGAVSPTRLKKKVVFADTQGHPLTQIRLLTERSHSPPRWSADFLEQVTGGAKAEALSDQWELAFAQPASDYLGMKARLEKNNVSLENVVINEAENRVTGTVKVRNLSYHKHVQVRYTTDHWTTFEDVNGVYNNCASSPTGASYNLYDTFTFTLPLPSSSQADKLEFCVCFKSDSGEYWDNNDSKNYVLVSFRPKAPQSDSKPKDAYELSLDSWSEFASWNHLTISDSPYW